MKKRRHIRKTVCVLLAASLLGGGGSAAFGVTAGELPQPVPTRETLQEQALE